MAEAHRVTNLVELDRNEQLVPQPLVDLVALLAFQEAREARGVRVEERGELEVLTPGSPLGVALMGAKVGDIVDFEAPGGVLKVEIVAIEA